MQVERHSDIVITYGRYRARNKAASPGHTEFVVWLERVNAWAMAYGEYLTER